MISHSLTIEPIMAIIEGLQDHNISIGYVLNSTADYRSMTVT